MPENCYICKNKTRIKYNFPFTKAGSYDMVECEICGFLRIDPIPDQDIINSLYTENSVSEQRLEYEVFSSPFLTSLKKNIIIKPLLYKLKNQLNDIKKPTLLDIGCATGWITSNSKDAGFDVLGLEANPVIAKYGRDKYGIEILEGLIEDLDINMKFNAITMFHILEHLTDPLQILRKVNSHLTDNGKLLIVIPNADSLGVGIFGQFYNWNIPDHISFFSPATISEFLKISGFRVLGISHLTSPPMLIYSFNKCMDHRKKNGDYGIRLNNPLISNLLFMPIAIFGKLVKRGEVIAVYAEKN